jgi:hypothetical protein
MDELTENIDNFFRWFRRRHANIVALTSMTPPEVEGRPSTFGPEVQVLIGAELDSLANHWSNTFRPDVKRPPHAERFQDFMETMANSTGIFSKVCGPFLRDDVQKELPDFYTDVERAVGNQEASGRVRFWQNEQDFATLSNAQKLRELMLPRLIDPEVQKHIKKNRFGEVIYREVRCYWVHELLDSPRIADPSTDTRIRYENVTKLSFSPEKPDRRVHRLVLPIAVLLGFQAEALANFEKACGQRGLDPTPKAYQDE